MECPPLTTVRFYTETKVLFKLQRCYYAIIVSGPIDNIVKLDEQE